ncbi:MAG: nucleotidyltransferase domain-containing protein [Pseudomonadota bacterium]
MSYPNTLPAAHKNLLDTIVEKLSQDPRIVGIGASGSFASNTMDQYSDIDLVIAIDPASYDNVMKQRFEIVKRIEGYFAGFTGEHVGEPRLIIALYSPALIHVDFKFVSLPDAAQRVDNTKVLWERGSLLSNIYKSAEYAYPQPDIQWIEDRFWIWLHYGTGKIARGEYFEALEFLSFLRMQVLSPLALKQNGLTPFGVRTIEKRLPEFTSMLKTTVATPDKQPLIDAFQNALKMYLALRSQEKVAVNSEAQAQCIAYFERELLHSTA